MVALATILSMTGSVSAQRPSVQVAPEASDPLVLTAVTDAFGKSRFSYAGQLSEPTMRVSPGNDLRIRYVNNLTPNSKEQCALGPCSNYSNLHFHGLHVSPNAPQDDVIDLMAAPGQTLNYDVKIPLDQPPGLYWYHTHPHGESYRQDLDGMSGAIVVEGIDRYVPELRHMRERILMLRDAELSKNKEERAAVMDIVDMGPKACGNENEPPERVFTVNGQLRPDIAIAPGERQFWRIANASPDLYADLELSSSELEVVALDGMPLAFHDPMIRTLHMKHVLVPPGGRLEAIVTGPANGSHGTLRTRCFDTGKDGDPNLAMTLANLSLPQGIEPAHEFPEDNGRPVFRVLSKNDLRAIEQRPVQFTAVFTEDKHGFYINQQRFTMNSSPMLAVKTGTYYHWRIVNNTDEVHPFHIHQVHFLAFDESGHFLTQPRWLDTVNVPVRGSVDLVMDFTDPIIRGVSVFHCHLLNHEDKGMMAKILFQ